MNFTDIVLIIFVIYFVLTVVSIILDDRDATTSYIWIILFIILPFVGFFIYMLVGRNLRYTSRKSSKLMEFAFVELFEKKYPYLFEDEIKILRHFQAEPGQIDTAQYIKLLFNNSFSLLSCKNEKELLKRSLIY